MMMRSDRELVCGGDVVRAGGLRKRMLSKGGRERYTERK